MADLVGTCPKTEWELWLDEGDAAGDPYTGEEWGWYTRSSAIKRINVGDRFYVVAHGRLRGWAPVTRIAHDSLTGEPVAICRRGDAVACTVPFAIPGFRGLRERWWKREDEIPFPDWKVAYHGISGAIADFMTQHGVNEIRAGVGRIVRK